MLLSEVGASTGSVALPPSLEHALINRTSCCLQMPLTASLSRLYTRWNRQQVANAASKGQRAVLLRRQRLAGQKGLDLKSLRFDALCLFDGVADIRNSVLATPGRLLGMHAYGLRATSPHYFLHQSMMQVSGASRPNVCMLKGHRDHTYANSLELLPSGCG